MGKSGNTWIANRLNEATNILFRVTKRSIRFHCTRERIPQLIWHHHVKVDQNHSHLSGNSCSRTFRNLEKRLRPSPLLKLKVCFSRQVNVVPPQAAAAKVTVLYVAVHLNLRSVKLDGSHAIHGSYVTCCKKESKHVQSLLQNVKTTLYSLHQPRSQGSLGERTWERGWLQDSFEVVGKTRNLAIQLVLQQCCKTSCNKFYSIFSGVHS